MIRHFTTAIIAGISCLLLTSCLYRGDGAFKQIGNSDFKLKLNFMNFFVAADGYPTCVSGAVLREDSITPLKNVLVILKKKNQQAVVSKAQTDHVGSFTMSGILTNDLYVIELDSAEYSGRKEIIVEPNRRNCHEIIAQRR
ncbi:MAG: hypothetical protein HXX17_09170 [Geobacteraceae bacterium]|nr:hypothetical protein [Geobacteraceae bacterium]